MKGSKIAKRGKDVCIEDILEFFKVNSKSTTTADELEEYFSSQYGDNIDGASLDDILRQNSEPNEEHDWWIEWDGYNVRIRNNPFKASTKKMKKYSGYTSYNDTEIEEIEEYRGFIISKVIDYLDQTEYYMAMDMSTGETFEDTELSSLKLQIDNMGKSKKKMKKSHIKKTFTDPLTVKVNGKEFSMYSTNDRNYGIQEYLRSIISPDKEGVKRFCNDNYELIGYTWYELMHEYIDKDYDYIVYAIAHCYINFIWDTCVHGHTYDRDKYFNIVAEWVSGGYGNYNASSKKMKKSFKGDFTEAEIKNYCPNATRVWDNGMGGIDVIWDLPSGNHPGIYISSHGPVDKDPVFVVWMTANRYLDYQELDTPDGNLPYQFEALATRIEDRVEEGNSYDNTDKLPNREEVIQWLKEMDELCAERMDKTSKKMKKSPINKRAYSIQDLIDTHIKEANGERYGEGYLTDDGWYDDQRYTIVTMDEVKISNRNFRMNSFGGGRVTFSYYKDMGNLYYRIVLTIPNDVSTPYDITWTIGDDNSGYDGITSQSHKVYQTGSPNDGESIVDIVNLCIREIKSEAEGLKGNYEASTKKSYTPEYHDFRTMLTNMKMTKDNKTVFKR